MRHLEIEFKTLLNKDKYLEMKEYFKQAIVIRQSNHYYKYSDESVLISTRIREINHSFTLTFKQDCAQGRMETNFADIDSIDRAFEKKEVKAFLVEHHLHASFVPIGTLNTTRLLIIEDHQEICLDENKYAGITDYELEVESIDDATAAQERFDELILKFDIKEKKSISKFTRYLEKTGN